MGQMQPRPGAWVPVDRPAYLRHRCEMSQRRLGVDRINLLHLHRVDPDVPFTDQIGTMKELSDEGKIAHVGPLMSQIRNMLSALAYDHGGLPGLIARKQNKSICSYMLAGAALPGGPPPTSRPLAGIFEGDTTCRTQATAMSTVRASATTRGGWTTWPTTPPWKARR
ncbi:aldo/keto reductase [Streptomyces sp. NBC_01707]|uniref:aldo/keto reductase n=1 Tax=Streptomyces sp. NBC_01707 TaxID=2975914 RepID=UPI00352E773E